METNLIASTALLTPELRTSLTADTTDAATVNLNTATKSLGERLLDPTLPDKTLLAIAEMMYKISGMSARQQEKEKSTGLKIVFNMPQIGETPAKTVTIGTIIENEQSEDEGNSSTPEAILVEAEDLLASLPDYVANSNKGNLAEALDFIDIELDNA